MFERSELRSGREERMENGVKNLKGAKLFPKTYVSAMNYNGYGNAFIFVASSISKNCTLWMTTSSSRKRNAYRS